METANHTDLVLELKVLGFPPERLPGLAAEALNKNVEEFRSLTPQEQTRVFTYAREMK
jgi:hypothetical protein